MKYNIPNANTKSNNDVSVIEHTQCIILSNKTAVALETIFD